MKRIFMLVTLLSAVPLAAQTTANGASASAVGALKGEWETISGYISKAAEQIQEADYAFRPVAGVRSFGELIGHLAGAQYLICAAALGEPSKNEDEFEKQKLGKAALIAAFKSSNEYCARAYAQPDADVSAMTKLFGGERTRLAALVTNTTHDGEHYGNIVTYMRIKGMVPPSSQPRPQ
ncbi:MAG: DinB family protein [Gemmatimonadota bacterium]|nr:DinB family protein [Gemmatimonadota bacterium]